MSDICGFAKVTFTNSSARSLFRNGKVSTRQIGQIQTLKFNAYLAQFSDNDSFKIDYATFKKILVKIKKEFEDLCKHDSVQKATILLVFSNEEWSQLKLEERKEHTLHSCKICSSKEEYSCLIPPTKPSSTIIKFHPGPRNTSRKQVIVDKTKEIINILIFSTAVITTWVLKKAYSKYIQPNDHLAKTREKLNIIRDVRNDIEAQWKENSVKRFVRYISSFLILEYLYLLFAKDYADSPKIKKKKKTSYVYFALSIIAIHNWCALYCQVCVTGAKRLLFGLFCQISNSHSPTHTCSPSPTALSTPTHPTQKHTYTYTHTHTCNEE